MHIASDVRFPVVVIDFLLGGHLIRVVWINVARRNSLAASWKS